VGRRRLERQFPTILGRCRELGLDPLGEPLPVAPAAHYWMGGVATDLDAATSVDGLYAVGEVACTGVHGANRLASNSLMECLVFARQLGHIRLEPPAGAPLAGAAGAGRPLTGALPEMAHLRGRIGELRDLCWQVAGVERQGHGLGLALPRVRRQRLELEAHQAWRCVRELPPSAWLRLEGDQGKRLTALQEWHQRLSLAELLIEAALFRQESRGGHFRTDAPRPLPYWRRHSVQRHGRAVGTAPVRAGGREEDVLRSDRSR
jgi:L-aspartate oxidase